MYVKEMHIEVMQAFQKIASNRTRKLNPEEIDWLLNKNMHRFIDSKVTPRKDGSGGFEIDQHDLDSVRNLMRLRVPISVFEKERDKLYYGVLPGDYRNLISDISLSKKICRGDAAPTREVRTTKLLVIPIRKSTLGAAPYYANASLTVNNDVVFNLQTHLQQRNVLGYTGLNSPEQIFEISSLMMDYLVRAGYQAYWERFENRYYPRSIIIESNSPTLAGSVSIDGVAVAGSVVNFSGYVTDMTKDPEEAANRLTPSNLTDNLKGTPYFTTMPEAPISELAGSELYVHVDKTFIVAGMLVTYVRKPQRISLILGTDCELSPLVHPTICDLTVEYIKAMIQSPDWEVKLKDNMLRSTT